MFNIKKAFFSLGYVLFLCCISNSLTADSGIRQVSSGPSELDGSYADKVVDMEVKVLGGSISVVRAYRDGEWRFNPGFNLPEERPLYTTDFSKGPNGETYPSSGQGCAAGCHASKSQSIFLGESGLKRIRKGSIIYRNGDFYRHNSILKETQVDDSIVSTETLVNSSGTRFLTRISRETENVNVFESAVWRDLSGNFMHYDASGATSWGNRYGITNTIVRDSLGRMVQVKDHADTVVYTYSYVLDTTKISAVTDKAGRVVSYSYDDDDQLDQVTDVRGKTWLYDYAAGFLKTDPDGRTVAVKQNQDNIVQEINRGGAVTKYSFSFNSETDIPLSVSSVSPAGVRESKRFDGSNRLQSHVIDNMKLRTIKREKDAAGGLLETETNENGYKVVRENDVRGNIETITYPDKTMDSYKYDLRFNFVSSYTNRKGIVTTYAYDANGNHTTLVEALGTPVERTTQYEYDIYGRLTKTTWVGDALTATSSNEWSYDANGNIASFKDGEGNTEQYLDYDVLGNYIKYIDAKGKIRLFEYDAAGSLLSITNPLGKTSTLAYDGAGNLASTTLPTTAKTIFAYDAQSRLKQITDALGKKTQIDNLDATQTTNIKDALGNVSSVQRNALNQISRLTDPVGNIIRPSYHGRLPAGATFPSFTQAIRYDANQQVVSMESIAADSENQKTEFARNALGTLTNSVDALDNEHQFELDELERIVKIIDPIAGETLLAYDRRDNLVKVVDPEGRQTAFEYNGNDQTRAELVDVVPDQTRREYDYDANGLLTVIRTPQAAKIQLQYDDASQLIQTTVFPNPSTQTPEKTITYGRDGIGRLTSYADGTTSATYSYDLLSRLTSVTTDFGPFSKTYNYSYYDNGWIKSYTNPESITYAYSYYPDGSIASVSIPNEGVISYQNYDWLVPQSISLPGGQLMTASYDDLLRLSGYQVKNSADQLVASGNYHYDKLNNIKAITTEDSTKLYEYDSLHRLESSAINKNTQTTSQENYSYDGVDNRLSAANDPSWVYNSKNQLVSHQDTSYEYNLNGHRSKKTTLINGVADATHYIYNSEERLIRVEDNDHSALGEYAYDPFGLRLKKTTASATSYYLYNGEGLAAEYDAAGMLIAEYHYGPNKPWMTDPLLVKRGGAYYYYQNDHLGTPQKLLSKSGQVVWQGEYGSFGEVSEIVSIVPNLLRFPGQYYDEENRLYNNYFRSYDPISGRYIESDPIGLLGGLNTYGYVYQNPLRDTDPLGLDVIVTHYKGEGGNPFDHIGIGTTVGPNANKTFGSGPDNALAVWDVFSTVEGHVAIDATQPLVTVTIPTTAAQDHLINTFNLRAMEEVEQYRLIGKSCVNHVRDALAAAGIILPLELVHSNRGQKYYTNRGKTTIYPRRLIKAITPLGKVTKHTKRGT